MALPCEMESIIYRYRAEVLWFDELQEVIRPFNDMVISMLDAGDDVPLVTALEVAVKYREIEEYDDGFVRMTAFFTDFFIGRVMLPALFIKRGEGREIVVDVARNVCTHMQEYGRW